VKKRDDRPREFDSEVWKRLPYWVQELLGMIDAIEDHTDSGRDRAP